MQRRSDSDLTNTASVDLFVWKVSDILSSILFRYAFELDSKEAILGYRCQTDIETVQVRLFTHSTWWEVMSVHVSKHNAMSDLSFADCFVPETIMH